MTRVYLFVIFTLSVKIMKITKHMKSRMTQRAINQDLVDLTVNYGEPMADGKIVLSRKAIERFIKALNEIKQKAQKAYEKGGLIVVAEGEVLITTYRLESYKQGQASVKTSLSK